MHVPFLATCGHSFCYSCLKLWFTTKVNCPTCRKNLESPPILNIQLKEISNNISDLIITLTNDPKESQQITEHREQMQNEYDEDFRRKKLFGDVFDSAVTLIDRSDGVPRCGNCHWEAHGSVCLHCGSRFRVPMEDSYYDSDDGDAYNEDDEEIVVYGRDNDSEEGPNEYDSQDSFIDQRDLRWINRDLVEDDPNDILSSDGDSDDRRHSSGSSDWHGFGDEGGDVENPIDLDNSLFFLEEEEDAPFVDGQLRNLDGEDNVSVSSDDDVEMTSKSRRGPSRVVNISSDEE